MTDSFDKPDKSWKILAKVEQVIFSNVLWAEIEPSGEKQELDHLHELHIVFVEKIAQVNLNGSKIFFSKKLVDFEINNIEFCSEMW
jgi:hypothetical protein